jgi:ATP-dependent RNA helicase DHX36
MIRSGNGASANLIVTQPRRISAIGVAERIAKERAEKVGQTCGYSIKLEKKMSKQTRLLLCTTGILLRRLQLDPDLASVSHIFVDEVHERDLNTDFLLIILKGLLRRRKHLKLVLMSATLNADKFAEFFDGCAVISIPGRTHPVQEYRLEDVLQLTAYEVKEGMDCARKQRPSPGQSVAKWSKGQLKKLYYPKYSSHVIHSLSIVDESIINYELLVALLEHISLNLEEGAILVFLPGMGEITKAVEEMYKKDMFQNPERFVIVPLHSSLSSSEQSAVFKVPPLGTRKIVLSTNLAETSITVEDVVYVVDTGRVKENQRDEVKETPALVETWVSHAAAKQRRGRAGRVRPGISYHMFSTHTFNEVLQPYQLPEMLRVGLEDVALQIMTLDLGEPHEFLSKALDPPSALAVTNALSLLEQLGAVECQWGLSGGAKYGADATCDILSVAIRLTALGFHLASLPVEPRVGKMLLYGAMVSFPLAESRLLSLLCGLTTVLALFSSDVSTLP